MVIPGVGTEFDECHKELRRANVLHGASTHLVEGEQVSVIAWLGHDTPGGGATGTDIISAPFGFNREVGVRDLDAFVEGLRASHDASPSHVTGIGHSYGSTVYGEAASGAQPAATASGNPAPDPRSNHDLVTKVGDIVGVLREADPADRA